MLFCWQIPKFILHLSPTNFWGICTFWGTKSFVNNFNAIFYLSILLLFLEVLCMLRTLTCLANICRDHGLHTENRDDESSRSIQLFKPQCSVTSAPALLVYQAKKERTLERKKCTRFCIYSKFLNTVILSNKFYRIVYSALMIKICS